MNASLVGLDSAGGGLLLPAGQQTFFRVDGLPVATLGVQVASHPPGGIHTAATVAVGSSVLRVGGLPAVFAGLPATCGDLVTGSGLLDVGA